MSPRFPISALRSVMLEVPDLASALDFYTRIWGLILVHADDEVAYLRATGGDAYVLALRAGTRPVVVEIAYRADDASDLAALRDRAVRAGAMLVTDITERPDIASGHGFCVRDPKGRRLAVVQGDRRVSPLSASGDRPSRLAHVNINCSAIERDIAFYRGGFGFDLTDRSQKMAFLRTNDDHHAVVLAEDSVDTLNHIAFQNDAWEGVMRAGGRMRDAGYPIGWGPGRHGPGDNVFLYFVDPFGIVIEHTAEVLKVDDTYRAGGPGDWIWPTGRVDQWGIAPPKTDACKSAQRTIAFA